VGDKLTLEVDTDLATMVKACEISLGQECFLDFIKYIFKAEGKKFVVGRHTAEICNKIDIALNNLFQHRISTYLLLTVPFRHGKTEMVSRLLPVYIVGKYGSMPENNPHNIPLETILGCYNKDLASGFSKHAKKYVESGGFKELFPRAAVSKESSAASEWAVDYVDPATGNRRQIMEFHAAGMLSGVTGKGASVLIIDDILKNREEAESQTYRDKQWNSYKDDFLTRLAPEFIHILCATRWHIDDVLGRVLEKNNPDSDKYDPEFPIYDVLHYRAKHDDGSYLFTERFTPEWYERQFASLGSYSSAALLQGDPIAKGGNLMPVDKVRLVDSIPPGLLDSQLPVRFWDLASTEKEVSKDDPDNTVGCRGFVYFPGATAQDAKDKTKLRPHFVVTDVRSCKLGALDRNVKIVDAAIGDGAKVWQGVEAVAGYKDSAATLKALLKGVSVVHPIHVHRDKFTRASEVIPPMDAGWVYFVRGWWNTDMMTEIAQFPSGKHDDFVDALSGCYAMAYARALKMLQSGYLGGAGFSAGQHRAKRVQYDDDLNANNDPQPATLEEDFDEFFKRHEETEVQISEA
jgi:predicted phage terminase large subunit-like protein